ncbi:unnamed protein product [Cunninghamella blakesleeana]
MDFLKNEIAQKRKAIDALNKGATKKKFFSRAELEKKREEEYKKEQEEYLKQEQLKKEKRIQESLQENNKNKFKSQQQKEDEENQKENNNSDNNTTADGDGTTSTAAAIEVLNISREEVVRRLRAKGQPIRLFGETDKECKLRLRALDLMEERSNEGGGQQNEYMRKMEEMEEGMKLEYLKQKGKLALDDEEELKKKLKQKEKIVVESIDTSLIRTDRDKLSSQIYIYLVHTMEEWDEAMDARPEDERRSGVGKRDAVMQKQTIEHLKPLLKRLKKRTVEPDVLARVAEITHFMQIRQYRDAQDSYLQLSIGNAPWPIGVTMVGIHERSAREKIFSSQVAHVLNDETSRKWIQGIKRLMTFAQKKYPPYTLSQIS